MESIVLCGSMKVKKKILEMKRYLEEKGFNVLMPVECMEGLPKSIASRKHIERIIDDANTSVLIVNDNANGIDNYIGPNTFAEIAFAFFYNKKIFLLNDYYLPYVDELNGWGVIPLNGNIDDIKKVMV